MGYPLANSTNIISVTLVDQGTRVENAVVTVTIYKPDKRTVTQVSTPVPHVGNGVYSLQLPKGATPIPAQGYLAAFNITYNTKEFNSNHYFNVLEG